MFGSLSLRLPVGLVSTDHAEAFLTEIQLRGAFH